MFIYTGILRKSVDLELKILILANNCVLEQVMLSDLRFSLTKKGKWTA